MLTIDQLQSYHKDGFILLKNVISAEDLERLRSAIELVYQKVNSDPLQFKTRYTQKDEDYDTWGVADILSPELRHPSFDELLAIPKIMSPISQIIGDQLRFWTMHSFWAPQKVDYNLVWHRDQQDPYDFDQQGQTTFLLANLSLYEDEAFKAVPGTHIRALNEQELQAILNRESDPLPNEVTLYCEPGDLVLFNALILHRGSTKAGSERRTVHFSLQAKDETKGGYTSRPWMKDEAYRESLHPVTQELITSLIEWEDANPIKKSLAGMRRAYRDHNHITK